MDIFLVWTKNVEVISDEVRRQIATFIMESLAFLQEHKWFWLMPILLIVLLLCALATWAKPIIDPYPLIGEK